MGTATMPTSSIDIDIFDVLREKGWDFSSFSQYEGFPFRSRQRNEPQKDEVRCVANTGSIQMEVCS